jgi:hypothetical protein
MKDTALERQVMTLEEIWEKLPDTVSNECAECYGSCAQCVYRKVDLKENSHKQLVVEEISCLYDKNDQMLQAMAKGNHYCKHFVCLYMLSKKNKSKC